jgi:FkbM family methyltransferase
MPENAAIIRRNIELNGLTNVTLVEKMVGAHSAPHTMVHKSNATVTNKSRSNTIEIDGTTIDALAREFGTPSLITVDIEGLEYQVLEGGRLSITHKKHPLPRVLT